MQTINKFAQERGHDRRTIARRLKAADIQPAKVENGVKLYAITDMERVMFDHKNSGLPGMAPMDRQLLVALAYLGQFLPDCVDSSTRPLKLPEAERDRIALRLWAGLVLKVAQGLPEYEDLQFPIPESLAVIAQKRGVDAADLGALLQC